jgi:hypothetical protein
MIQVTVKNLREFSWKIPTKQNGNMIFVRVARNAKASFKCDPKYLQEVKKLAKAGYLQIIHAESAEAKQETVPKREDPVEEKRIVVTEEITTGASVESKPVKGDAPQTQKPDGKSKRPKRKRKSKGSNSGSDKPSTNNESK